MGRRGSKRERESRGHRVNFKGLFDGFRARRAPLLRDLDKPGHYMSVVYYPRASPACAHTRVLYLYVYRTHTHTCTRPNQFSSAAAAAAA